MARILMVDDTVDLLAEAASMLEESGLGYEVQTASEAPKALELLEKEKFDLVILDIMMPGKNGVEMLHEIKRRWGLPVIIYSAYLDHVSPQVLLQEGADQVLTKPAPFDHLIHAIRDVLEPDQETTLIIVSGYQVQKIKNQVLAVLIQKTLRKTKGNVSKAAGLMGISRECLSAMLKRLQIIR